MNEEEPDKKKPICLSLFSGIGGFEVGMSRCGFEFVKTLEWDNDCCATLNANKRLLGSTEDNIQPIDIMNTKPSDFYDGSIDYIVGGPPCQSFSAAGRRAGGVKGTSDIRGTLFWYYCQYVDHFKPKAFVFENVRGILSSKKGEDFKLICSSFRDVGYKLHWRILNAADFGVPQARERLFLVGIRDDLDIDFKFPAPTYGPDSPSKQPYVTTGEALKDLDDPNEVVPPYPGKWGYLLPDIPPGENYRFFTEEMGHPNPVFAWRSRFSGFLYKMDPNDVCRTIVSQQGNYDGPFHWKNRKCTADEFQRLQGFPADYVIPQNYIAAVKQIGNSVCPPVAEQIGRAIRYQLEGLEEYKVPLLEKGERLGFDKRKGAKARASRKKKVKQYSEIMSVDIEDTQAEYHDFAEEVSVRGQNSNWTFVGGRLNVLCGSLNDPELLGCSIRFAGGITRQLREINVTVRKGYPEKHAYAFVWAAVHQAVARLTTYESLMPLYGHFTEPYPKFTVEMNAHSDIMCSRFQKEALKVFGKNTNIAYVALGMTEAEAHAFVAEARKYGYDARDHTTNITIPEGYIRICYPFVLPKRHRFN